MSSVSDDSLSSLDSNDFAESDRGEDTEVEEVESSSLKPPPAKRRRVSKAIPSPQHVHEETLQAADIDLASDTSGSCPPSPKASKENGTVSLDESAFVADSVHVCQWNGCQAGDLGDPDVLINHMVDIHVPQSKDDKFACDWGDCRTKTRAQLSAYALRAHMRSHTKEKPYICSLPECDRAFTRSDALTKHMRTVHENEGSKIIETYARHLPRSTANNTPMPDHLPSSTTNDGVAVQTSGPKRIKLTFGTKGTSGGPSTPQHTNGFDNLEDVRFSTPPPFPLTPKERDEMFGPLPTELEFDEEELLLNRRDLHSLLRRQAHWATQDSVKLEKQLKLLESQRREEWLAMQLLLENVLEADYATAEVKGIFDTLPHLNGNDEQGALDGGKALDRLLSDSNSAVQLPLVGPRLPWYRDDEYSEKRKKKRAARTATINGRIGAPHDAVQERLGQVITMVDDTEEDNM